jgi:hypothetical protein
LNLVGWGQPTDDSPGGGRESLSPQKFAKNIPQRTRICLALLAAKSSAHYLSDLESPAGKNISPNRFPLAFTRAMKVA